MPSPHHLSLFKFKSSKPLFSKTARQFLTLNLLSVVVFAILYELVSRYGDLRNKASDARRGGDELKDSFGNNLWFSLITQSTVGYGSPAYEDMPTLKKGVNMLQMSSIFLMAAILI